MFQSYLEFWSVRGALYVNFYQHVCSGIIKCMQYSIRDQVGLKLCCKVSLLVYFAVSSFVALFQTYHGEFSSVWDDLYVNFYQHVFSGIV